MSKTYYIVDQSTNIYTICNMAKVVKPPLFLNILQTDIYKFAKFSNTKCVDLSLFESLDDGKKGVIAYRWTIIDRYVLDTHLFPVNTS